MSDQLCQTKEVILGVSTEDDGWRYPNPQGVAYPITTDILAKKILELFEQEQNMNGDDENVYVAHAKTS